MKMKKTILLSMILIFILSCNPFYCHFATNDESLSVYAPSVILMDQDSGKILYEKNAYEKRFPASTTKLMTAILTVENCNLDEVVKVSYNAVFSVPSGYSNAALQVDEELTVNDLLHALLIPSANDAANVLAEHIAGSIESFCTMMNTKAVEIGCKSTHFVNPSGIHNDDHYSTAYDLSLIAKYASQYEIIKEIACTTSYTLPTSNKYSKTDRYLTTTNCLLKTGYPKYYYEYANGLKTGYTTEAKDCIIATASKEDKNLIAVILGAESTIAGMAEKYLDCKTLFDYGFDHYTKKDIIHEGDIVNTSKIKGATIDTRTLDLQAEKNISVLLKNTELNITPSPKITLKQELSAPISKGEIVGTLTYEIDGVTYSTNLIAKQDVEKSSFIKVIFRGLIILLLLFILYSLLNATKKKKRKRSSSHKANYITRYK